MKVAIVLALFAMLAVATAFYPGHYYGGLYGYPYYTGAAPAYYGHPYYNGWGHGYPYYGLNFNQAAQVAAAVAPAEPAAAESAVPVAE